MAKFRGEIKEDMTLSSDKTISTIWNVLGYLLQVPKQEVLPENWLEVWQSMFFLLVVQYTIAQT